VQPNKSKPVAHSTALHKTKAAKRNSVAAIEIHTAIKSSGTGARKTAKQNNDLPSKFGKSQKSKSEVIALKNVNHSV